MSALTEQGLNGLQVSLYSGVEQLSNTQTLTFSKYIRQVISQDGFVFWVNTGQTMTAVGSIHYATSQEQDEDQTIGMNTVLFTSENQISEFNAVNSGDLWIAEWMTPGGQILKIAFSRQGPYYPQSVLWHYSGFAVFPPMASQILQSAADLPTGPIVNDSLPIWLSLPASLAAVPGSQAPTVPVYASFLVPENIVPPYIVAHVDPGSIKALGAFPILAWPGTTAATNLYDLPASQLMSDMVRLTFYGFTNQQAIQYLAALIEYSYETDAFGFQNSPAFQDEKRAQSEITAIAMKKTLVIKASYYQQTSDALARRLILSAALGSVTT